MSINNKQRMRLALILLLGLVAGVLAYPQVTQKIPKVYDKLNAIKINLGLDLQ